jgi:hypothetical protein
MQIPVLRESGGGTGRQPIVQIKELEPDWQRYNSWRASLIESYATWLKRWKQLRLNECSDRQSPPAAAAS